MLVLSHKGKQGKKMLKITNIKLKVLPLNKNKGLVYKGTRLETKFNAWHKTKKEYHHNLTCSVKCPMKNYPEFCNDKTGMRLIESS